ENTWDKLWQSHSSSFSTPTSLFKEIKMERVPQALCKEKGSQRKKALYEKKALQEKIFQEEKNIQGTQMEEKILQRYKVGKFTKKNHLSKAILRGIFARYLMFLLGVIFLSGMVFFPGVVFLLDAVFLL
ncbi:23556_t:CDS:2, partial [Racocetra persica]